MNFLEPDTAKADEPVMQETDSKKPLSDDITETGRQEKKNADKEAGSNTGKKGFRKSKSFQPIILIITFALLLFAPQLYGQFYGSIEQGITYTDNAYQLSDYDLQRNEQANPDLDFINSADDAILKTKLNLSYDTRWHWWAIQPSLQFGGTRYVLNSEKQRFDFATALRISRKLGSLGISYAYSPEIYIRNYNDTGGTGNSEEFSYTRNLYKADLNLKPFKASTVSLEYSLEQQFYNEYFTEFDGDVTIWTLAWKQSLPVFYAEASYGYKVYDTASGNIDNPEDASYESNILDLSILIKKMQVDSRYQTVTWRPELNLQFEERFYQGGDAMHRGRTDNLNTTTAILHFYFGEEWNLNLDYSHIFRNVDAVDLNVRKYKEFSESRFGINAKFLF
jgi:hypothetical protein